MATLDWVFLAVLLASFALGAWRGLVYEVLSVLGWIAAFVLAQWLAPDAAALLPMGQVGEAIRYAAGFVLVFVASAFGAGLLAWLVKKLVEAVGLRPVDRVLGGVFGAARGAVAMLAVAVVVHLLVLSDSAWWHESRSAVVLDAALQGLKPALPDKLASYLP